MQIKDHVFIVTGASSGIGLSTVIALSERGAKVALLARSTDALQKLAQQLPGSLPVTVDMTQFDRVREAVGVVHRHYGRVDGLVNNAGRSYAASVEEIDPALFDEIFHLNVLGPIVAMQAVIPLMRAQGGGSIVNINSGTAFMTVPQYSVYSSSKRALLGFSLAELEKDQQVLPGFGSCGNFRLTPGRGHDSAPLRSVAQGCSHSRSWQGCMFPCSRRRWTGRDWPLLYRCRSLYRPSSFRHLR
jgi:short-subunit dehydrogenase involved in D-alanine esterification of teichoic acids